MGRPDYDPAASDEPLYTVPDMGADYLYASQDQPSRVTEGFLGKTPTVKDSEGD